MKIKTIMSPGIGFGTIKVYERGKELDYDDRKFIILTDEDLIASDTMGFNWEKISGIITTKGTKNSHSAIVAKQHEVPAMVVSDIKRLKEGDFVAIDTYYSKDGEIYYFPTKEEVEKIIEKLELLNMNKENLEQYKADSTITKDGHKVLLLANIGTSEELENVQKNTAEGIGVVRTEFSYEMYDMLENRLPTEDELYKEYKKISDGMKEKTVIIRTLDAGADKPVKSLYEAGILKQDEVNPALGSRGIRPCLQNSEIFKTQIKAILRANAENNNLQIMFPMITSIEEIEKGKQIVNEAINELSEQKIEFARTSIGIMVETPAIAQITDKVSKYCDFISVGTNDLTQYTTAADRMNNTVETIANPYNPGMVRLLNTIISGAHNGEKSIFTGVCGEIGGDLEYIPILIGMGIDELSMNASNILPARRYISHLTVEECRELLNDIMQKDTASEIQETAKKFYKEHNLQIFAKEKQDMQNKLEESEKKKSQATELKDRYYQLTHEKLPKYLSKDSDDYDRDR